MNAATAAAFAAAVEERAAAAAAALLGSLAVENAKHQEEIASAGALRPLCALLLKGAPAVKEQVCFAIWNLSCQHPANQAALAAAGALKPLVALLGKGTAALQEEAAGALMNLSANQHNKTAIAAAGGVEALVPLLAVGGGVSEQAAGVLMNLAADHAANRGSIVRAGAVQPLLAILSDRANSSRRAREYVAGALMNLSLGEAEVCAEIAKHTSAIIDLVAMLAEEEGQHEEVAGALTNLADGNLDNQRTIAAVGAIKPLVRLLRRGRGGEKEEAAGTLMNLAACGENAEEMAEAGAVEALAALLRHASSTLAHEHAAGAIANMVDQRPQIQKAAIKAGAVTSLCAILEVEDNGEDAMGKLAVGALGGLEKPNEKPNTNGDATSANTDQKQTTAVANGHAGPPATRCASTGAPSGRVAVALALLTAHPSATQPLLDANGIRCLTTALRDSVDEAADALAALALSSSTAREAMLTHGGLDALVAAVASGPVHTQEAAAAALARLLSGGGPNATALNSAAVDAGAMLPLVMLLSCRGGGARSARAKAAAALTALIEGGEKKEQKEKNRIAAVEAMALPAVERLVRDISKSADAESHKQGRSGLEAALRCLGALLAGDTLLRAIFVEEGGLSALWPLAAIEPAAAAVLDAFDDCFGDLIAAEKEKVKDAAPAPPIAPPKKKADKAKGAC